MKKNIYALLVGIDKYPMPVSSLQGCVNDVTAIEKYLETRIKTEGWELHLQILQNEEATREAIIDGFRQHLCQADANDVAFFYYSGHGSQEPAPPEFWHLEPDKLNETLVCYDSRLEGGWDLADKELAFMVSEVGQRNPHITLILDCCHSGSGTKDPIQKTAVRQYKRDKRLRPLDSFIFSPEEIQNLISSNRQASGWNLPRVRHILLASCQDRQTAKEYHANGQHRGAFCYFLTETLNKTKGNLTYRDLFKQTSASVRNKVKDQSPQLEAIETKDLDQLFLGGAINEKYHYYTLSYDKKDGWVIDGGAIHGIPPVNGKETTQLALFPIETQGKDLRKLSNKIAHAQVTKVLPQLSKVEISGITNFDGKKIDQYQTFKAVIINLPLPPKTVSFEGDAEGVKLLRQAIQTIEDNQPSLYVRENNSETVEFKILACNGEYVITRPADGLPIVAPIQNYTKDSAIKVIQRLEHMTRWTNLRELSGTVNSSISADAIEMEIYQGSEILSGGEIWLNYHQDYSGNWKKPAFKVKLRNTSNEILYCALFDLTEQFSIHTGFFEAGCVRLEPNQETWALSGKPIRASIPQELWERGITEYQDIFKLIVCTSEFDARLLEQDKLDLPFQKYIQERQASLHLGSLNHLFKRLRSRDLLIDDEPEEYDDWMTKQIVIKTIKA